MVEFVLVSMITGFGPTAGQALSGVLAYRAVNFWLPIPFGGLAYASLEFERRPAYRKLTAFLHRRFERAPSATRPGAVTMIGSPSHNGAATGTNSRSLGGTVMGFSGSDVAKAASSAGTVPPAGPASGARSRPIPHLVDPGGRPEPAFGSDPGG